MAAVAARAAAAARGGKGDGAGNGGGGSGGTLQRGGSGKASRSIEEIKLVFERNKGAIYAIYNRALREDPALQGKVVVELKIAPSGGVVDVPHRVERAEDARAGEPSCWRASGSSTSAPRTSTRWS